MLSLVVAGEAIFGLPFHVSRYFRPTYIEVFSLTQTQLGVLGSIYGLVATFAYIMGGGLADRFSPRTLLVGSLVATGASGIYMATIPTFPQMCWLFGFWGISTILPFWAALIKATRQWGGHQQQGIAFGILDGGRGLFASLLAMLSLFFFAAQMPGGGESASLAEKTQAIQTTVLIYTGACFVAAACVWIFLPGREGRSAAGMGVASSLGTSGHFMEVVRTPAIWLQAMVIVAAYCTFKGIDFYSQYAKDVWGWSEVSAAGLSAYSSWMRPLAAVGAGLLADRLRSSVAVIGCFALTAVAYVSFIFASPEMNGTWWLWFSVLISSLGLFGLRGIYFALLEESRVPRHMTGTAVGVISFVGYTPEIFMPLLGGWLLDAFPGEKSGYIVMFSFLLIVSVIGIAATIGLRRIKK